MTWDLNPLLRMSENEPKTSSDSMKSDLSLTDRFFTTLVDEIRQNEPAYLHSTFTVAEIYQSLVPYRTHRDQIGVEMNGDYEDALLRLLAGEGEYLEMESDTARERIRLELRSSNPNTGLYREYAAVGVRVNREKAQEVTGPTSDQKADLPSQADAQEELPVSDEELDELVGRTLGAAARETGEALQLGDLLGEDEDEPARPKKEGSTQARVDDPAPEPETTAVTANHSSQALSRAETPTTPEVEERARPSVLEIPDDIQMDEAPSHCPECTHSLPDRDSLCFCPYCGINVFVLPCKECDEILERGWNFCIACGTGVD
jgi:hypothetical protein